MRCKNVDSTSDMFLKISFQNWQVVQKLVDRHTRISFSDLKTVCHSSFFLRFFLWKKSQNCQVWRFYVVLYKKLQKLTFRKQSFRQNLICKRKTWYVLKLFFPSVTRCKFFPSKTTELWKSWLTDTIVSNFLTQKLFANPVFFSDSFCERKHKTAKFVVFTL